MVFLINTFHYWERMKEVFNFNCSKFHDCGKSQKDKYLLTGRKNIVKKIKTDYTRYL